LFFVYFDLSIVGMYFIIAGWGHGDRARAAATPRPGRSRSPGRSRRWSATGLLTGALFLLSGVLYDRGRTDDMDVYSGLSGPAPVFAAVTAVAAFGSLGLPGLSGIIAEFQIFTGSLATAAVATAIAVTGILITAALFLRALQRIFSGPLRLPGGPRTPAARRDLTAGACLAGLATAGLAAADFGTRYAIDTATGNVRIIVLAATLLIIGPSASRVASHPRETEFYVLLQLAALGTIVLAGAADLLLLFAGYLLTSVPGYALAGFAKDGPGTEAAMKYYLIGALHGVFMLAGITVLDLLMAIASRSALAVRSLLSYLAAYAVTNLGAFAVVTELRHASTLADYRGLARRHPGLAAVLVICLLSLVGTPPTCVFACKLEIFTATIDGGYTWLAALAVANTIASLFYYLRWLAPALLRQPAAAEPDPLRAAGHWAAAAAYTAGTISHALGIAVGAVLPLLTGTCCDDRGTAPGRCGGPAESGGYTVGNVADPEPVGGITGHQVADRSDAGGTIGDLVPCSTPPAEAGRADVPPNRRGRPLRLALLVMMAVILAGAVAVPAYLVTGHRQASGQPLRPSGIPPGHLDQPRRPDVAVAGAGPAGTRLHAHRPERARARAVGPPREGRGAGVHGPALRGHLPARGR